MRKFFIVGSQGIPANYGGLETFAEQLATRLSSRGFEVYVTCEKAPEALEGPVEYKGVKLLYVDTPANNLRTIVADCKALKQCARLARKGDVIYLLGYGVGPFAWPVLRALKARGITFWLNPDGLEWKRPRWPRPVRGYLRFAERFLLRQADKVICDAAAIKHHHHQEYGVPNDMMEVIEYGAPLVEKPPADAIAKRDAYLAQYHVNPREYYTYVGRFVPDNNLEIMVRGVLDERIKRKLFVFASHKPDDPFYKKLDGIIQASSQQDKVILTGGVYDQSLLQALRLSEFAYFHGHEVGGTNPALVEAMGLGSFILALDTVFNREVLLDAALFFDKNVERFVQTVLQAEALAEDEVNAYRQRAVARVRTHYNWERIADLYETSLRAYGEQ